MKTILTKSSFLSKQKRKHFGWPTMPCNNNTNIQVNNGNEEWTETKCKKMLDIKLVDCDIHKSFSTAVIA